MEQKQTINNVPEETINVDPLVTFQDALEMLREILNIQCIDGNWNSNPYMHGLANGMILALALFDDKCPEYLKAPETWLDDIRNNDKPSACK